MKIARRFIPWPAAAAFGHGVPAAARALPKPGRVFSRAQLDGRSPGTIPAPRSNAPWMRTSKASAPSSRRCGPNSIRSRRIAASATRCARDCEHDHAHPARLSRLPRRGSCWLLPARLLERVERQYLEAAEEPMVDTAQIVASIIDQHVERAARSIWRRFAARWLTRAAANSRSQIYNLPKTAISTHLYVTDRRGVVLFDSDDGKAEGQDFSGRRDVGLTLAGQYGARSTRADPDDPRTLRRCSSPRRFSTPRRDHRRGQRLEAAAQHVRIHRRNARLDSRIARSFSSAS